LKWKYKSSFQNDKPVGKGALSGTDTGEGKGGLHPLPPPKTTINVYI